MFPLFNIVNYQESSHVDKNVSIFSKSVSPFFERHTFLFVSRLCRGSCMGCSKKYKMCLFARFCCCAVITSEASFDGASPWSSVRDLCRCRIVFETLALPSWRSATFPMPLNHESWYWYLIFSLNIVNYLDKNVNIPSKSISACGLVQISHSSKHWHRLRETRPLSRCHSVVWGGHGSCSRCPYRFASGKIFLLWSESPEHSILKVCFVELLKQWWKKIELDTFACFLLDHFLDAIQSISLEVVRLGSNLERST